jgi:hypothetical protein
VEDRALLFHITAKPPSSQDPALYRGARGKWRAKLFFSTLQPNPPSSQDPELCRGARRVLTSGLFFHITVKLLSSPDPELCRGARPWVKLEAKGGLISNGLVQCSQRPFSCDNESRDPVDRMSEAPHHPVRNLSQGPCLSHKKSTRTQNGESNLYFFVSTSKQVCRETSMDRATTTTTEVIRFWHRGIVQGPRLFFSRPCVNF